MEYLNIVTLGPDQPNILSALSELATKYECHILRSQATTFGSDLATMSTIYGNGNGIARLEDALHSLGESHEATILINRTQLPQNSPSTLSYKATIVGLDDGLLIHELISFFVDQKIIIDDMDLITNLGSTTETPLFKLQLIINLPSEYNIAELRNQFLAKCEELNVDGKIESKLFNQ